VCLLCIWHTCENQNTNEEKCSHSFALLLSSRSNKISLPHLQGPFKLAVVTVLAWFIFLTRGVYDILSTFGLWEITIEADGNKEIGPLAFILYFCWEILPTTIILGYFRHIPSTNRARICLHRWCGCCCGPLVHIDVDNSSSLNSGRTRRGLCCCWGGSSEARRPAAFSEPYRESSEDESSYTPDSSHQAYEVFGNTGGDYPEGASDDHYGFVVGGPQMEVEQEGKSAWNESSMMVNTHSGGAVHQQHCLLSEKKEKCARRCGVRVCGGRLVLVWNG